MDYLGIPGRGVTNSLSIRNKIPNKKQKAMFAIADINNQDFINLINIFNISPYQGYKSKQFNN